MSVRVAVVPGAPALVGSLVGEVDVLAQLRSRARAAVERTVAGAERVVLICATDRQPRHTGPSWGRRVAAQLVGERALDVIEIPWEAPPIECADLGRRLVVDAVEPARTAIVVVADGSASRSTKAPGYFDSRAAAFDDLWTTALRRADGGALLALDPSVAAELGAHGRAPLQVLAGLMAADAQIGQGWLCESVDQSDPFGVLYVVAELVRSESGSAWPAGSATAGGS